MTLSDKDIIKALKKFKGNLTMAAEFLGCDRGTIYKRMQNNPNIQKAREEAEERRLDLYEAAIDKAALVNGDVSAIKYVLSTRGKKRGYSEKQEVELTGTGISINLKKVEYTCPDGRDD